MGIQLYIITLLPFFIEIFIPQWKFKRMHSILIIIFKSHQNLI
jgi:hypothetical protein